MKKLEIITASLSDLQALEEENYLPFSLIGKVYGDYYKKNEIQRIVGINIFRLRDHIKAEDYLVCYFLYHKNLNRLGFDRIINEITQKANDNGFHKVALCGYGIKNDFCFRHIVSYFFQQNGLKVSEYTSEINFNQQKIYWETDIYKQRGHFKLSNAEVTSALENSKWIFAKTMPKNPHEYILRKDFGNDDLFLKISCHIRYFGKLEEFQGILYRVLYTRKYKYWTCPCDLLNEDVDLINRTAIENS